MRTFADDFNKWLDPGFLSLRLKERGEHLEVREVLAMVHFAYGDHVLPIVGVVVRTALICLVHLPWKI